MKTVIKTTMLAAALSFGLVACDGPKENAMEDAGEQNAEMVNAEAEASADAGMMTDNQAEAMTDKAENKADEMEKQGEMMDQADGNGTATDAAKQ